MRKQYWIGPPEHNKPSDQIEIWLESGDLAPYVKPSKKSNVPDDFLIVGFDTEYKTPDSAVTGQQIKEGEAISEILSYQFYAKTIDGVVWQGICCPEKDQRLTLQEFMLFVLGSGSRLSGLKSISSKIYLVGHFTRADIPAFADFAQINNQFSAVRNTFVSIDNFLKVEIPTDDGQISKLMIHIRDTMLLTPQSSRSLKKIGELVGIEKVELSPDRSIYKKLIRNMDRVRSDQWDLFKRYALTDAEICVHYIEKVMAEYKSVTGKVKVPVTLTGIGIDLLEKKWTESGVNRLAVLGKEAVVEKVFNKSRGYYQKMTVEVNLPLVRYNEAFATDCYHGGRNEQFWFGPGFPDKWSDYDLSSAYPTAMSLIGMPDWNGTYQTLNIDEFTSETLGFASVEFEFPSDCRFPTLPVRTANGLIFPLKGKTECAAPEIYLAKAVGAKLTITHGVIVPTDKSQRVFEGFIKECIERRNIAGSKTLQGLFWKEISNSTYGKTAQGLRERRVYDLRDRQTKQLPPSRITNAYFAAYITSFVRAVLGEIMNSIPSDKTVFSCTTDGFLSTINEEESVAATKGHLCELYRKQREILSGSSQVLEIKHQVKTPLGWRTRGQATLDTGDFGETHPNVLLAKGGIWTPPEFEEKEDQNDEIINYFFDRTTESEIDIKGSTGLREMIEYGADLVEKVVTKRLNMEYDWKRRPLGIKQSLKYDHIAFSTEPWSTAEQFAMMRETFDEFNKNSPRCIKNINDLKILSSYVETKSSASGETGKYIKKTDGDVKRLRQMLCAAFKQRKAGIGFSRVTNEEFANALKSVGIPCVKTDVENGSKKKYLSHQVLPTDRVVNLLHKVKGECIPSLDIDDLLFKFEKGGLSIRLINDESCQFIDRLE